MRAVWGFKTFLCLHVVFFGWINDLTINSTKYNIISVISGLNVSETDVTGLRIQGQRWQISLRWWTWMKHRFSGKHGSQTGSLWNAQHFPTVASDPSYEGALRCLLALMHTHTHTPTHTHTHLHTNWKWVSEANLQHSDLPNHDNHHKRHSQLKNHPLFGLFSCSLRVKMIFPC